MTQETSGSFGTIKLLLLVGILFFTFPYSIYLFICMLLFNFSAKSKNPVALVANQMLYPSMIGLGIFTIVYFFLRVIQQFAGYSTRNSVDQAMMNARLATKSYINVSTITMVLLLLFLLFMMLGAPKIKALTQKPKLLNNLSKASFYLVIAGIFLFFAQKPADRIVHSHHRGIISNYNTAIKNSQQYAATFLAAKLIEEEVKQFSEEERTAIKSTFDEVQSAHKDFKERYKSTSSKKPSKSNSLETILAQDFAYQDARPEVVQKLALLMVNNTAPIQKESQTTTIKNETEERKTINEIPQNSTHYAEQQNILQKRKTSNIETADKITKAIDDLELTFVIELGLQGTMNGSLGETFIQKVTSSYATKIADTDFVQQYNPEDNAEIASTELYENRPFRNLFFIGRLGSSSRGAGGISNSLFSSGTSNKSPLKNVRQHFASAVTRQQDTFSTKKATVRTMMKNMKSSSGRSGYGSGRSTRSYGG